MLFAHLNRMFGWPFAGRQKRVMRARVPLSKDEFVALFTERGISGEIASEVREMILGWCDIDGFTPYPEDKLGWLYGLGEEDLDEDIILVLLRRFDCHIPTIKEMESEKLAVDTVADIVELVDRMQKKSPVGQEATSPFWLSGN